MEGVSSFVRRKVHFIFSSQACSHYENRGKEKAENIKAYEAHVLRLWMMGMC
jgi:hypothetical protein